MLSVCHEICLPVCTFALSLTHYESVFVYINVFVTILSQARTLHSLNIPSPTLSVLHAHMQARTHIPFLFLSVFSPRNHVYHSSPLAALNSRGYWSKLKAERKIFLANFKQSPEGAAHTNQCPKRPTFHSRARTHKQKGSWLAEYTFHSDYHGIPKVLKFLQQQSRIKSYLAAKYRVNRLKQRITKGDQKVDAATFSRL